VTLALTSKITGLGLENAVLGWRVILRSTFHAHAVQAKTAEAAAAAV